MPKVVTQQRHGRASNPRLLDRKSDALPLSHRAIRQTDGRTTDADDRLMPRLHYGGGGITTHGAADVTS